ncbi:MAG TPA: YfiR family protein [Steroidobacteraceae bacterium]|nr:YfiR family protein [Steroidobacteraceae bacterium]
MAAESVRHSRVLATKTPSPRKPLRILLARWMASSVCLLFVSATAQNAAPYSEDAIKAAYLYRLAGYVEWPGESAASSDQSSKSAFTIAVLGAGGVAERLKQLLPTLHIKNRPAQVHAITALSELRGAQILYVRAGNSNRIKKLIESVPKKVLVVTDDASGLEMGSVINFVQVGRKVRFEVSLTAAQRGGFRISSELLALAVRVDGVDTRAAVCSRSSAVDDCSRGAAQR